LALDPDLAGPFVETSRPTRFTGARLREIPWFGLPPDDIGPALRKRRGRELHSTAAELTDYGTQDLGMVATATGHDARMQQKSAKDQSDV
jgi:hypothetical protein